MRVIRNCKYCKMNKTMKDERNTKKSQWAMPSDSLTEP